MHRAPLSSLFYVDTLYKSKRSTYEAFNCSLCQKEKRTQSMRKRCSFVWLTSSNTTLWIQWSRFVTPSLPCWPCWVWSKFQHSDCRKKFQSEPWRVRWIQETPAETLSSRNNFQHKINYRSLWASAICTSCSLSPVVPIPLSSNENGNSVQLIICLSALTEDTIW